MQELQLQTLKIMYWNYNITEHKGQFIEELHSSICLSNDGQLLLIGWITIAQTLRPMSITACYSRDFKLYCNNNNNDNNNNLILETAHTTKVSMLFTIRNYKKYICMCI